MTADPYQARAASADAPARRAAEVTPHDDNDLSVFAKALYLGQGGDLRLIPAGGGEGNAKLVPVADTLQRCPRRLVPAGIFQKSCGFSHLSQSSSAAAVLA